MTGSLKKYSAAILCGGRSQRMGFDKSLLLADKEGRLLLASLADQLAESFGRVLLITDDKAKLAHRAELAAFSLAEDNYPGSGPLGAIVTALDAAGEAPVFVTGCDMPLIDWKTVERLCELLESSGADIIVPRSGQRVEPLFAFYGPGAAPIFYQALAEGRLTVREHFDLLKTAYLDLDPEQSDSPLFKNLNRPEDVQEEGFQMTGLSSFSALHYENGRLTERAELVIAERAIAIYVNGRPWLSVMATPQYLDDLAVGLLFGEGVINSIDEVTAIIVDREQIRVTLSDPAASPPLDRVVRLSGFGSGLSSLPALNGKEHKPTVDQTEFGPLIKAEMICNWVEELNRHSGLFQKTGGVHGVRFVNPGDGMDIFFDDVGRHNALDKVIGRLLKLRLEASEGLILTTGRVSVEILLKANRAGIRMLASRSAPTDRGVELARRLGLTLIGFARGRSFNIYAGEQRITEKGE